MGTTDMVMSVVPIEVFAKCEYYCVKYTIYR